MQSKSHEELVDLLKTEKEETMRQNQIKEEEMKNRIQVLEEEMAKEKKKFQEILCDVTCKDNSKHTGDCLICGKGWGRHPFGHDCPQPFEGRRGVWFLKK